MLRIRHDKPLWQADSLVTLEALIAGSAAAGALACPVKDSAKAAM